MTCALYLRVSTKDKGQDTESQAVQMREFCTKEGHTIVEEYTDTVSGSGKARRPAFERMMADAEQSQSTDSSVGHEAKRFEMLLFWSLDRLSREGVLQTLQHLERLDKAGVCWRSHTEAYLDSCGVFRDAVLAILAAIAKQERIRISERVTAGLARAAAEGRHGGRPYPERDPALLAKLREMHEHGASISAIAKATNWPRSTVQRLAQG